VIPQGLKNLGSTLLRATSAAEAALILLFLRQGSLDHTGEKFRRALT
jgi:hypothetical protein